MEAIIVPCTQEKVWDSRPDMGPTAARDAYSKPVFGTWRKYAEESACRWFILSTKFGLVEPDRPITAYNVPVSAALASQPFKELLRKQGDEIGLGLFDKVVLLDWEKFRPLVKAAVGDGAAKCVLRKIAY